MHSSFALRPILIATPAGWCMLRLPGHKVISLCRYILLYWPQSFLSGLLRDCVCFQRGLTPSSYWARHHNNAESIVASHWCCHCFAGGSIRHSTRLLGKNFHVPFLGWLLPYWYDQSQSVPNNSAWLQRRWVSRERGPEMLSTIGRPLAILAEIFVYLLPILVVMVSPDSGSWPVERQRMKETARTWYFLFVVP